MAFSANGTAITGCATEVANAVGATFVATCPWTPALTTVSPVSITAELTPTVVADGVADAAAVSVNTTAVTLTGSAIYLGQNAKLTANTYSQGTVSFSQGANPLPGCTSMSNAVNGNGTAYVVSCTVTAPPSGGTVTAQFTPTNGTYTAGSATYNMVVNTVVLSGGAGAVVGAPSTITANANEAGTVEFDTVVASVATVIPGCSAVTSTSSAVPYVFTCSYSPAAVGTTALQATLTPASGPTETSANLNVTAADIVLSGGSAIYGVSAGTIVASTYAEGSVEFDTVVSGVATAIPGCSSVDTIGAADPFVALCTWTPSAAGPAVLRATLTPTSGPPATSANFSVTVGTRIQGQQFPISMYVDTIMGSGPTGTPTSPIIGAGCAITNEFLVGQTIVFRVYGNDAQLNGAPLTPVNVSSATVTIAGFAGSPITMTYGSHGGQAFWVGVLSTGTKVGQYNTLGVIPFKVTFNTMAVPGVPAVTKQVPVYQYVRIKVPVGNTFKYVWVVKAVPVKVHVGNTVKTVWHAVVLHYRTVIVTPAVPAIAGATGTFNSAFNPASQATLNAIPTVH